MRSRVLNHEVVTTLKKIISESPTLTPAYQNLGSILLAQSKFIDAISVLQQGLTIDPANAYLYHSLGDCLKAEGRLNEAVNSYRMALCLDTHDYIALANLGAVYKHLGLYQQAEQCLKKTLKINPDQQIALYNLGIVYEQMWEFNKAYDYFDKAITLDPNFSEPYRNKYLVSRQLCDFKKSEECEPYLDRLIADDPFISIIRHENLEKNLQVARSWSKELSANIPKNLFTFNKPKKTDKIHIAYISNDFRSHPIGIMTAPLFKLHNRKKFKVSAYSYGANDQSIYREMVKNDADHFVDIKELGIYESAKKINEDKVDILIDLTGYTENHRLEIMAMRPAKTQITWLGFPGGLGAEFVDFLIADRTIIPKKTEKWFNEKILTLPHCYQINDFEPLRVESHFSRKDLNFPPDAFVFASFNQSYKIDPLIWNVWMNILKKVDGSVLCLWQQASESTENLIESAQKLGIKKDRLFFWESLPKEVHLSRVKLVDLALDTRVYGGHTTTTDCLRMGVPVITKIGNHFASRVCASILTEVGLSELVVNSLEAYESLAIELAKNPHKLKKLRVKLKKERLLKNLFNAKRFVKNLEELYENCVR